MNRLEFMKELEMLLSDITPSEREEAIQYYNDYLNDAGVENEQEVLDSLGTPRDLAKVIKEGLNDNGESGEFTETGYKNEAFEDGMKNEVARKEHAAGKQTERRQFHKGQFRKEEAGKEQSGKGTGWSTWSAEKKSGNQGGGQPERKPLSAGMMILIIILCVIALPVLAGIAVTVLGTGVGILGGICGLVIGIAAAGIGLLVAAVILIVFGIAAFVTAPLAGICYLGLGILMAGISLFFLWLTVWIFGKAIPWLIRAVVKVCSRIFHRREEGNV